MNITDITTINPDSHRIDYGFFHAPFSSFLLATLNEMICALFITENQEKAYKTLQLNWPDYHLKQSEKGLDPLAKKIAANPAETDIHLIVSGTEFQQRVWKALCDIPAGKTAYYQNIAEKIGQPNAVRAVGTAIGKNPISLLIPCHRVVPKQGGVGNYAWGSDVKKRLLAWEKSILHPTN